MTGQTTEVVCPWSHENESERVVELVSATVDNWNEYDTVFVGYPIWWGIAAWPVNEFIETNDFAGKTVIPFCTSASSDLGESGELLAEMAGTGIGRQDSVFAQVLLRMRLERGLKI